MRNIVVHVGDWIVKFDEYQYDVFNNKEFEDNFEPV